MEINCRNSNWRAICSPGSIKPCTNPPGLFIRNLTCRSIQNTFPTTIGIHLASMKLKHRFSTPFPCSLENSQYVRHRPIIPNHHPPDMNTIVPYSEYFPHCVQYLMRVGAVLLGLHFILHLVSFLETTSILLWVGFPLRVFISHQAPAGGWVSSPTCSHACIFQLLHLQMTSLVFTS